VSIVALGCLHPDIKAQSASIHFFLGTDDDVEDSENEDEVSCIPRLWFLLD
jgi:protein SDA1